MTTEGEQPRRPLSPAAQAAVARYRRLLGNVAGSDPVEDDSSPRSDLERHLVDRPPHWAPPHRERPAPRRSAQDSSVDDDAHAGDLPDDDAVEGDIEP